MFQHLKAWLAGRAEVVDAGTLGVVATQRLLYREMARADRSGLALSLIRVTADYGTVSGRTLFGRLIDFLDRRLRITDDVGRLSDRDVAVILPMTSYEGAEVVAQEIETAFGREVELTIHCYPNQWWLESLRDWREDEDDQNQGQRWDGKRAVDAGQRVERIRLDQRLPFWKRSLDIVGASLGLLCLSPVFALVALLIKTTSPGPICFRQRRTGRAGKPFTLYKFRSMILDADARKHELRAFSEQDGPAFKMTNDPRVTSIGRLIRKTSLDELPQLWNVLTGDMTLVGPRPLPCDETAGCQTWHLERLQVTPGLTCIWQVYGRSRVTFDEWMRMDVRYIRNMSMLLDLKLIGLTAWSVVFRKDGV